jgi:ABC-2 type transport system permease protein
MSGPASFGRLVSTQAGVEARVTLRRGENLLAMVLLPAAALWVLGSLGVGGRDVGTLLPGVLALALVASGLVNLAIATGFERGYGVLKRLGGSPLGRDGLLAAKLAVVAIIGLLQVLALVALAALLGWPAGPGVSWPGMVGTTIVGSAALAGIGLLLAGTLRPEATLVVANVLFLVALVVCGVVVPIADLPAPLAAVARVTPPGALAEAYRVALGGGGVDGPALALVAAWGVAAGLAAIRWFRWD